MHEAKMATYVPAGLVTPTPPTAAQDAQDAQDVKDARAWPPEVSGRIIVKCSRCGSTRWVSVSLDGGWTRRAQCVPCGAIHDPVIGPGWRSSNYNDPDAVHPAYRR